jgi:hypothetical protein
VSAERFANCRTCMVFRLHLREQLAAVLSCGRRSKALIVGL